jgi:hypothetical protein
VSEALRFVVGMLRLVWRRVLRLGRYGRTGESDNGTGEQRFSHDTSPLML